MAVKRGGLGRGLDALIPDRTGGQKTQTAADKEKSKKKAKTAEKPQEKVSSGKAAASVTAKTTAAKSTTVNKGAEKKPAEKKPTEGKSAEKKPAEKKPIERKPAEKKPVAKKPVEKKPTEESSLKTIPAEIPATAPVPEPDEKDHVVMMKISKVEPNREQPRKEFDKEKLEELAESIKQYGVIQPLLVQKNNDYYEIIAGERRWRASQIAGLKEVPVIVREYSEQEAVEISLIENIQREDLNPIEEANAYVRLMDEFHLTQEKIAERVSRSRAAVTNAIRLLRLPEEIRTMLIYGDLMEGHARALLGIPDAEKQVEAARKVVSEGLSVRDTEKLVKQILNPPVRRVKTPDAQSDLVYRSIEEQLKSVLGTKVAINRRGKSKGKIEIEYYSAAELERLLDLIRSIGRQEGY